MNKTISSLNFCLGSCWRVPRVIPDITPFDRYSTFCYQKDVIVLGFHAQHGGGVLPVLVSFDPYVIRLLYLINSRIVNTNDMALLQHLWVLARYNSSLS